MQRASVLIVGSGGREHALAWALARSPRVAQVYVAPGNAGTEWGGEPRAGYAASENVPLAVDDIAGLLAFAREKQIDLTVVGPEAVLALGIVDAFQAAGLRIFGPTRAAVQLEASKSFAKAFMHDHQIPTAASAVFDTYDEASLFLSERAAAPGQGFSIVVKADGLAAGKGVMVCTTLEEAQVALHRTMVAREFGAAGDRVVLEDLLIGREVSLMAFCDGRTVVPMLPARDHKRLFDGDHGPNTGGMGVYAPVPDVSAALVAELTRSVLQPVVDGMAARGAPYSGVLYAGLILTAEGPQVLEFNCRFGDPETQVVLPLLATGPGSGSASFFEILLACAEGRLAQVPVGWQTGACAGVVLASPGYPGPYPMGAPISGLKQAASHSNVIIFHAGTARSDGHIVTAGGRVLAICATGADLPAALDRVYEAIDEIDFDGMNYRRDIGRQERISDG